MAKFIKKFFGFFFLVFSAGFAAWYPLFYLFKGS